MFASTYSQCPFAEINATCNYDVSMPKIPADRINLNYELEPVDMEYEYEMENLCEVENAQVNASDPVETVDIDLELEFICMGIAFMDIKDEDWDEL